MKVEHTLDRLAALKSNDTVGVKRKNNINSNIIKKNNAYDKNVQPAGSAKVDISEKAMELNTIKKASMNETDNSAKIARLKRLIKENNYQIKDSEIAEKMINEHLKTEI